MNVSRLSRAILGLGLAVMPACGGRPAPAQPAVETAASAPSAMVSAVPAALTAAPVLPATVSAVPAAAPTAAPTPALTYPLVDTSQGRCYDQRTETACAAGAFAGQDAQFLGLAPSYTLAADGLTVQDHVTGLTWQHSPDTTGDGRLTAADKLTWTQAQAWPAQLNAARFGGYADWRLPSIKELYSLIDFRGTDPSGVSGSAALVPFIDTAYFQFAYGDAAAGERTIDAQYASSTLYTAGSAQGGAKLFGVNFADGRIKGYDLTLPGRGEKTFLVLGVRGQPQYGQNVWVDNGDQTITDKATGRMWAKADSGAGMDWPAALAWVQAQNAAHYLGYTDWRLPDIKELQSLVDYSRSPDTTDSAALAPVFESTAVTNEAGRRDFPYYWSSTTHAGAAGGGETADYLAFGRALGYLNNTWVDVHGAGAQRSDPKTGDPAQFPRGRGPQGDAIRIDNYVRLVRGGEVTARPAGDPAAARPALTVTVTETDAGGQPPPGGTQPGGGPGQGGAPPAQALQACAALNQGAACSFTAPHGTITGTCQVIQGQLACVPAGP